MILILLLILVTTLAYWKLQKHYSYWRDNGVKQRNQIYFVGDSIDMLLRRVSLNEAVIDFYKAFPGERYMGMYQMTTPSLLIRDPELIKQITVKDFDHFLNHRAFVPEGVDPLWNRNLFALKDTEWRDMRSTLSPSFTSSKMKMMFSLISDCADEFMNHFLESGNSQVLELKDTFTRYTNDVIASIAFGIQCNSIKERDNKFYTMGIKATMFGPSTNIKFFIFALAPRISKMMGLTFFPSDVTDFFFNVIKEAIHLRETQGIVRPDMLNLLLEARRGKKTLQADGVADTGFATVNESTDVAESSESKQVLTDIDIAAQALVFFFGGFESVATLMTFAAYELTLNREIQQRLQKEIDETFEECNGKLTYEELMKMKYMDMIISETLRKWPAAVMTDRICSKPYTINPINANEKSLHLKPGDLIWIPINGIHYDEMFYPNPHKFDPERFNDKNKANINPYTYMPFGVGPRNCIGSRFALLESKAILFHMLRKFDLLVCPKTDIPIRISKKSMQMRVENGAWIELKPRIRI